MNFKDDDVENYKYFSITKAQLDFKAVPANLQHYSFTLGSVISPLKLRLAPFDFSKDFTIGTTFGVKYIRSDDAPVCISALLGMGVSSVSLDSFYTAGKIRTRQEVLAFTPSIGVMFEFGNAQVGLFSGIDFLSSSNINNDYYIYKNKPWISIGLGYAIFSSSTMKK
jgi:hypothetical protein